MAATIWKGVIRLGEAGVPVKLRSGVADRAVHFRLLHALDEVPVEQRMVDSRTGTAVPWDETLRGYEADTGEIVILTEEELEDLDPPGSRDIEITRVVPTEALDHRWYVRPYWLAPDGDEAAYFALARALEAEGREAVARWTMREKAYRGALRARDGYLALVTLRPAGEVVPVSALEPPAGRPLEKRERQMAARLVEALADAFEPEAYEDAYRARLMELIEAKASGKSLRLEPKRKRRPRPESLAAALERSLEVTRRERSVA